MEQKDPNLLTQKELKQMYMYKYLKSHKNDNHGISNDIWKKLKYGNFRIKNNNNFHNNQDMNRPRDPMQRYNDIIRKYSHTGTIKSAMGASLPGRSPVKIPKIKPAIPVDNNNENVEDNSHGMKRSEWKALDKNVRRKLKKYGFSKNSEVNPAFVSYITKKIEKKKLKKGVKSTL